MVKRTVDLYRQGLDIPEKPRTIGWLFLAIGGVMVVIAVGIFFSEARERAKYQVKPGEIIASTSQPGRPGPTREAMELARAKARKYIWTVVFATGLLFACIIILTVNHRFAQHLRNQTDKPSAKTTYTDPWKESGRRIRVDRNEDT